MSSEPDYVFCNECQTPCYTFEWDDKNSRISAALCGACGNDDPVDFAAQDPSDMDSDA